MIYDLGPTYEDLARWDQELAAEGFDIPACRVCGCTDLEACEGGCVWVEDPAGMGDICSSCI